MLPFITFLPKPKIIKEEIELKIIVKEKAIQNHLFVFFFNDTMSKVTANDTNIKLANNPKSLHDPIVFNVGEAKRPPKDKNFINDSNLNISKISLMNWKTAVSANPAHINESTKTILPLELIEDTITAIRISKTEMIYQESDSKLTPINPPLYELERNEDKSVVSEIKVIGIYIHRLNKLTVPE